MKLNKIMAFCLRHRVLFLAVPNSLFCTFTGDRVQVQSKKVQEWINLSRQTAGKLYLYNSKIHSDISIAFPEDDVYPFYGSDKQFLSLLQKDRKLALTFKDILQYKKTAEWCKIFDMESNGKLDDPIVTWTTLTLHDKLFAPVMTSILVMNMGYVMAPERHYLVNYKTEAEIVNFGWSFLPVHFFGLFIFFHFALAESFDSDPSSSETSFLKTFAEHNLQGRIFSQPGKVRQYFSQIFEDKNYALFIMLCIFLGVRLENRA